MNNKLLPYAFVNGVTVLAKIENDKVLKLPSYKKKICENQHVLRVYVNSKVYATVLTIQAEDSFAILFELFDLHYRFQLVRRLLLTVKLTHNYYTPRCFILHGIVIRM